MKNITADDLLRLRMRNLGISNATFGEAQPAVFAKTVTHLGAVQAQDFPGAKWSLGLRAPGTTDCDVEAAIAEKAIVRTWALRGTLHLLPAKDVRWILALIAPRVTPNYAGACRRLALTEDLIARSQAVLANCLAGGRCLTRPEVFEALEAAGIPLGENRGSYILYRAALDRVICQANRRGKEFTFTVLDEWTPGGVALDGDDALAELTRRYFSSHGPATERDFAWWSGLTFSAVRAGIAMIRSELVEVVSEGQSHWMSASGGTDCCPSSEAYLLPGFDEFMLGYRDRGGAIPERFRESLKPANGVFTPIIVIDGRVVGTWRRTANARAIKVEITPFAPLSGAQTEAIAVAAERFCAFHGKPWEE